MNWQVDWTTLDTIARALALPVAGGIFLNQLDELFMDANYLLRGLHRRARRRVSWKTLQAVPQKRIAILVPAWKEADVIRQMLEHNVGSLDYERGRYTFFCGTYRNDPDTQREVDAAARRFSNVRKVVVPHDGPTSKADCLNWVYQGIVLDEQQHGGRYDILLMHDAEDVIHPLSLRLYSLLIPRHDFVQTPVFSLELGLHQGVAATYIDEFAEHHLKDMMVRERIGGLVPSAGVGSAFRREAFEEIARAHGQHPFNVESLTEDYEIGLKFRLAGKRVHFACRSLEGRPGSGGREEIIATREYFPGGFRASVQQRSRWILGIALQTWRQIGWKGPLAVRYCLWRDRKALLTNTLVLLAYLVAGYGLVRLMASAAGAAPAFGLGQDLTGRILGLLLAVNLGAMAWRAAMKAKLVGRLYGWGHALASGPRLVLGNLISLMATSKAVTSFVKHRITGAPLRWLKTAHVFPNVAALQAQRRRLGQLLVEEHGLSQEDLDEALALQQELGRPLGEIIGVLGLVSDRELARALARVNDQQDADPDGLRPAERALAELSEAEAERLGVVPLAGDRTTVRLAAQRPLDREALRVLEQRYGGSVEIVAAPAGAVRDARRRGYRQLMGAGQPLAGERQPLLPHEVDGRAIDRLGLGYCALYGLVPLLPGAGPRLVAAAYPVHPVVLGQLAARLAEPVKIQPVEALDVDVALATRESKPGQGQRAMCTMDVLEALEADGSLDATAGAHARANLLGLSVAAAIAGPLDMPLLPPELNGPNPIVVRAMDDQSLVLATPRPTPRLARALAALYPGWAIAWEVSLPEATALSSPLEEELPWTASQFKALTN